MPFFSLLDWILPASDLSAWCACSFSYIIDSAFPTIRFLLIHCRKFILALLSLVFLCTGASVNASPACQSSQNQKTVMSCCIQDEISPVKHDCCKQKISALQLSSSFDTCSCKAVPTDAVPAALSLRLLPLQQLPERAGLNYLWQECRISPPELRYEPPNLRRPREKVYLIIRSLLI